MSDLVSVELLLDAATEEFVRAEWAVLQSLGLSSLGAHTSASNRPHVTVLARYGEVPDEVGAAVGRLPLRLRLGAPLLFVHGDRAVLARAVVPTLELLELHASVHELAAGARGARVDDGSPAVVPHTRPGAWSPHVTLARRLKVDDLPAALDALGVAGTPVRAGALDAEGNLDAAENLDAAAGPGRSEAAEVLGAAVGLRRWDARSRTLTEFA